MEEEIADLEETIKRTQLHLEKRRLKMERSRARTSSHADGSSVPRPCRPLEAGSGTTEHTAIAVDIQPDLPGASPQVDVGAILPRSTAMPRTPAKVPKFNGETLLEPYLAQFQLAVWHGGWSSEEAATHLALALEGNALQVLLDLTPGEQRNLETLTGALERRFGQPPFPDQSRDRLASCRRQEGGSLGAFAADIQLYARHGYPMFDAAARGELALHAFLKGLMPEQLRQHVRLTMPRTLEGALQEAVRAEAVLCTQAAPRLSLPHVRAIDCEGEEAEPVCQVQFQRRPAPAGNRRPRSTLRCYRCDEPGHIARDCPAPAPVSRAPQQTGNDGGVAQ